VIAAASAGLDNVPIPACWIGTEHSTSLVNRVVSMPDRTSAQELPYGGYCASLAGSGRTT
jgi:hypothetical protein